MCRWGNVWQKNIGKSQETQQHSTTLLAADSYYYAAEEDTTLTMRRNKNFDFEADEMSKDGEKTNVHVLVTFFDCFGDGTTDK